MFDLNAYLENLRKAINARLEQLMHVPKSGEDSDRLLSAMAYSTLAGGKRLRPILCVSAAAALGTQLDEQLMDLACALELIHTYSLIHDDLPAIDNDQLRRGKPTCHVQFDEATAILAGDALLTFAFDVMAAAGCRSTEISHRYVRIIQLIANAAGHKGMVKGQVKDILSEKKVISLEALKEIHRLKTGALIHAAVISGALLAGASPDQCDGLSVYADNIGLAFQVMDDILNIEGDPALMGKAVGTDAEMGKCTYPALMGLEESKAYGRRLVNKALRAIDRFDNKAEPLREIATYIINRKK